MYKTRDLENELIERVFEEKLVFAHFKSSTLKSHNFQHHWENIDNFRKPESFPFLLSKKINGI